jgi:cytochrome c-type biogenesis protein CcmH/NrfG
MKRYGVSFVHEELVKYDEGYLVLYEDHLAEVDKLKKQIAIYEKVIRDEIHETK